MFSYNLICEQPIGSSDHFFLTLTKTKWDGSSQVLHCVTDKQISFGSYHVVLPERDDKYDYDKRIRFHFRAGHKLADEAAFTQLLDEDILERILRDSQFLKNLDEREWPWKFDDIGLKPLHDLREATLKESKDSAGHVSLSSDYRAYVIRQYIQYLLNLDGIEINAHPQGLFTEIHVDDKSPNKSIIKHGGVNHLPLRKEAAEELRIIMESFIVGSVAPWPDIYQHHFLEEQVPRKGNSMYLEISSPTDKQIQIIDDLFNLAAEKGFFPDNPKAMIHKAWETNRLKIATSEQPQAESASKPIASNWSASSPTLLSAPLPTVTLGLENTNLERNKNYIFLGSVK